MQENTVVGQDAHQGCRAAASCKEQEKFGPKEVILRQFITALGRKHTKQLVPTATASALLLQCHPPWQSITQHSTTQHILVKTSAARLTLTS